MSNISKVVRRSKRLLEKSNQPLNVTTKQNRISKKVVKKTTKSKNNNNKKEETITTTVTTEIETETEIIILSQSGQLNKAIEHIKKNDPKLAVYLDTEAISTLKKKYSDKRSKNLNPYEALLSAIIYQQIHGKAAEAIYKRFLGLFDNKFPTPKQVLETKTDELRSVGLSARKAEYITDLSNKFVDGTITPDKFNTMSPKDISEQLCSVKGIGQWTVDMFLMSDLHHSDILPLGDLAVRKGVANHFGIKLSNEKSKKNNIPPELSLYPEIWRPYRTLGSWLMWRIANTKTVDNKK